MRQGLRWSNRSTVSNSATQAEKKITATTVSPASRSPRWLPSQNATLIMVNTVGFVAAYNVEDGLAWGLLGAAIVTICTFLPSFVFINSGAHLIDRIRHTGSFAHSLQGVTIAVVGVIPPCSWPATRPSPAATPTGW